MERRFLFATQDIFQLSSIFLRFAFVDTQNAPTSDW